MENIINVEYIIRLFFAVALGFSLGLERELTNKYAGLRTHILVCLGACVFTILSIYAFPTYAQGDNIIINNATGIRDTSRVAAQIVTGIGFIGAGTVLRNGPMIIGLTTAATLWISAAIGMTCGVGMYGLATLTTISSVAVLTVIRIFERKILPSSFKKTRRYKITLYCNAEKTNEIRDYLKEVVDNIEDFSFKKLFENPEKAKVTCTFELIQKKVIDDIYKKLTETDSPDAITIQELND